MDKNSLLAILLSTVVLVGYFVVVSLVQGPKEAQKAANQVEVTAEETEVKSENVEDYFNFKSSENKNLTEKEYTIETDKAIVILTNKGGDIVSYKLKDHYDKEEKDFIQMVDNVNDNNRAFALSFGANEDNVINDIFNVKVYDDKTIAFYKNFEVKDADGNVQVVTLGKKYTFKQDDYAFKLDISVNGKDENGFNLNGSSYTLRTSPQIGPKYNKNNRYEVRQVLSFNGNKKFRKQISNRSVNRYYEWAGIGSKYFTILVKPMEPSSMSTTIRQTNENNNSQIFLTRNATTAKSVNDTYYIYVGPRNEAELIKYNSNDKNAWQLTGVKFNQALSTSGLFNWLEIAYRWCLVNVNKLVHNWGISIIIITIILKLLLFPLSKNQAIGSVKMQKIQPEMEAIQTKYADNQQKMNEEMHKLYKKVGYNPMSGCLPLLFQLIILMTLYNVFNNYFEFRGTSFIPGWIDDLSTGDSVYRWEKNIPLITSLTMNNIRILPIIYTVLQVLSGYLTQKATPATGPNAATMKIMTYVMPVMILFMLYNAPSGLFIYWCISSLFAIGQQFVINAIVKKEKAKDEASKPVVNKNEVKFKGGKKKTR